MKNLKLNNSKNNTVWVVTGRSESGDDYGPEVFKTEPSERQLKKLVGEWDAGDWDGPGDYGSYVYLTVTETKTK